MRHLISFIKNPISINIIGFIFIALLIWFAGPAIKFGEENKAPLAEPIIRILCIAFILIIWLIKFLIMQIIATKKNSNLVSDLKASQPNDQDQFLNDQSSEEIAQINDRFQSALETLNKLTAKASRRGKALYQLPWYIIIGPPGAGKTTTLVNSGLEFPLAEELGKGALQGVGGTRNCDWWFTNDAVLIDTAGRYTTQDSHKVVDSSAWEGFLSLLKRNRRRRPINGAIIAISLQDLLLQTEEERAVHARTIRARIDELMEKLEVRFPVYIMFTKVDLVPGFSEFFEDLTKEERDQVFGVSLPNSPSEDQAPDFAFLRNEFKAILARLYNRVLLRMHQERDPKRCAAIEGFPLQMELAINLAENFVKTTFSQNRFNRQPYLRGAYFSSGTQDGTPIDRLMTSVASSFGLSREVSANNSTRGRSYFINRLFKEVIFPESELVGTNQRYDRLIRLSRSFIYVAAGVATLGILLVWSGSVTRSNLYIHDVRSHIQAFNNTQENLNSNRINESELLTALNHLKEASEVYDQESHPVLSGFGLYDGRVNKAAKQLYQQKLKEIFTPYLIQQLEQQINHSSDDHALYTHFRLYMMFDQVDKMALTEINAWFSDLTLGEDNTNPRASALMDHFNHWSRLSIEPTKLNSALISHTRAILLNISPAQRIYRHIKSDTQLMRKVNFVDELGSASSVLFDLSNSEFLKIPSLFTYRGYKSLDLSKSSSYFSLVGEDAWVLYDKNETNLARIEDTDKVSREVTKLYLDEYAATWSQALNQLNIKRFSNLHELTRALQISVDPLHSPIIKALETIKSNTQLTPQVLQAAADKVNNGSKLDKGLDFAAARVEINRVDQQYLPLHNLVSVSSQGISPITLGLQQVSAVNNFVQELTLAPEIGQQSFEIAKARFQSNTPNAVSALRIHAKANPELVQKWFTSISDESWRLIMQSAHSYVSKEWRTQVYQPYQQALAGRYPLFPKSSDELALMDFNTFFKPEGTIEKFEQEYLSAFIDKRNQWLNKSAEGYGLGLSNQLLQQLQRAKKIRDVYFKADPSNPSFSLDLRPYFMSRDDAIFTLDLGEQRVTYNHGPKFWRSVQLSSGDDNRRVRMIFQDVSGSQQNRDFYGPWAWFKLMDEAKIEATGQSNIYKITFFHNPDKSENEPRRVVFEGRTSSVNNPFKNELLTAFRCPETI